MRIELILEHLKFKLSLFLFLFFLLFEQILEGNGWIPLYEDENIDYLYAGGYVTEAVQQGTYLVADDVKTAYGVMNTEQFQAERSRISRIGDCLCAANSLYAVSPVSAVLDIFNEYASPKLTEGELLEAYETLSAARPVVELVDGRFVDRVLAEQNTYEELYQQYYSSCQQMLINGGYTIYTSIDPDIQASLQESIDNNLSSFKKVSDDGIYELQGAATCIDNSTGNVVAIVGSRSQDDIDGYTLNRAYQSYRQPGSCIKPVIVYVPYLQLGNNPDTIVNDERIDGGPSNADGTYSGQMTLRTAVSKSKNTVAWKIYRDDITPKAGIGFLLNMGFHKIWMDKSTNAAALGGFTYGVSTEEMAGAYATIVNDGEYRQPTCVEKILNTSGKAIVDTSKRGSRVYDTNSCRMMTDMLRTVVTSGTGVGAEPSNAIVAGKTGTTNSNKDAWFCGYSQYYTTAIWMGYDYPKTLSSVKTLAIFKDFMYDIHKDKKKVEFKTANGSYTKKNQTETETQSQTEEQTTTQQETTTVTPTTKAATTTQQATTKAQTPTTQQAATKTQQTKEQKTGEWEAPTKEDAPAQNISPY
jgi:penicillin-binding protein 1A